MNIDRSNFNTWKSDPVTKEVIALFERKVSDLEEQLKDPQFIMSDKSEKYSKYFAGKVDAIYDLLNVSYADLQHPEESREHA